MTGYEGSSGVAPAPFSSFCHLLGTVGNWRSHGVRDLQFQDIVALACEGVDEQPSEIPLKNDHIHTPTHSEEPEAYFNKCQGGVWMIG